ncbi:MAG: helix-turn-helix domain-containing protein, partial [Gammaproteobacteria bacterium]
MSRHSEQFKLSVIKRYISGPLGFKCVADEVGVGVALVKRWVAFYRVHGVDGIQARARVGYGVEFKLKVLRHMWENHLSCAQTAAHFNIRGQCNIAIWQRRYRAGGVDALMSPSEKMAAKPPVKSTPSSPPAGSAPDADNRSREQLLDKIQDLEMEVAYLKKLRALIQSQREQ